MARNYRVYAKGKFVGENSRLDWAKDTASEYSSTKISWERVDQWSETFEGFNSNGDQFLIEEVRG